ncbi:GNAT family N-acetyltransferase [Actinokineospora enzanensis]|uniref:GNAT family N-acetyltransferase n=1 Tax=Actinokineospora enzanensis TaxID=155975 RepID=UPI000367ADD8|nr:GNAT family N-acetyltransferase [Actinokineospora enzanensis]
MIEIRPARPGDADALGEVHAESWAAAYAPFYAAEFADAGVRDRRTRWHARIGGAGVLLLGLLDDRPSALSYTLPTESGAEIHSFYTHPDGWGSGVSPALMTATLDHLRANGFTRVHLWTLRDTPRARRFYAKAGFVETGATRAHDFGDGTPLPQVEFAREC